MGILGFRNQKTLSKEKIVKLSKRFKVPVNNLFMVEPSFYNEIVKNKNLSKKDKQNLEQPNQILVFDKDKNNVTNLIDCNIGGFPILKWNRFKGMDSIPIKQGFFYTTPVFLSKNELDHISIKVTDESHFESTQNPSYFYYILWSRVLFRNSKKMIKQVNKNLKIAKSNNIPMEVKFIFSDSMFY